MSDLRRSVFERFCEEILCVFLVDEDLWFCVCFDLCLLIYLFVILVYFLECLLVYSFNGDFYMCMEFSKYVE